MNKKIEHKILEYGEKFILEAIAEKADRITKEESEIKSIREFYDIPADDDCLSYDLDGINAFLRDLGALEGCEWGESLQRVSAAFLGGDCSYFLTEGVYIAVVQYIFDYFFHFEKIMGVKFGKLVWLDGDEDLSETRISNEIDLVDCKSRLKVFFQKL